MTGVSRAQAGGLGLGALALGLAVWAADGRKGAVPQALETPACTSCDARHSGLSHMAARSTGETE